MSRADLIAMLHEVVSHAIGCPQMRDEMHALIRTIDPKEAS